MKRRGPLSYTTEFRAHWRNLMAATLGLSLGSSINHYTLSMFGPALIADLGWSKADFALVGSLPLLMLVLVPVAGRFTDRFGTRTAALVGFTAMPLGFLAMSFMRGGITEYFAIYLVQHAFGILTTSMVFCRVVVERFDAARGIALSLVMTGPPLAGAIAAPVLGEVIADHGWRAGYQALALVCLAGGLLSIPFMGRQTRRTAEAKEETKFDRAELMAMLRNPMLLLILGGMFLVNVPQVFASSQLKLVVMDSGVTDQTATWMVSLYAIGVIIGRFASGLALDRVSPHIVAIAALGLPAVGYVILASHVTAAGVLMGGVMVIGLAQGAESDIGAYLISRRFDLKNFSLLLSLMTMTIGLGSAVGSVLMSATLRGGGGYGPFLVTSAVATLIGAALFALTGPLARSAARREQHTETEEAVLEQAIGGEIS